MRPGSADGVEVVILIKKTRDAGADGFLAHSQVDGPHHAALAVERRESVLERPAHAHRPVELEELFAGQGERAGVELGAIHLGIERLELPTQGLGFGGRHVGLLEVGRATLPNGERETTL